jgi:uridine kinase
MSQHTSWESVLARLPQDLPPGRSAVIGLDGLGGAGKTTRARELAEALTRTGRRTAVLHLDDFIHERAVRYNPAHPEWYSYYVLQWRFEELVQEVLQPLRAGGECRPLEGADWIVRVEG